MKIGNYLPAISAAFFSALCLQLWSGFYGSFIDTSGDIATATAGQFVEPFVVAAVLLVLFFGFKYIKVKAVEQHHWFFIVSATTVLSFSFLWTNYFPDIPRVPTMVSYLTEFAGFAVVIFVGVALVRRLGALKNSGINIFLHVDRWLSKILSDEVFSNLFYILLTSIPFITLSLSFLHLISYTAPNYYESLGDSASTLLVAEVLVAVFTLLMWFAVLLLKKFKLTIKGAREVIETTVSGYISLLITIIPTVFIGDLLLETNEILSSAVKLLLTFLCVVFGMLLYMHYVRVSPERRATFKEIRKEYSPFKLESYKFKNLEASVVNVYIRDYFWVIATIFSLSSGILLASITFPDVKLLAQLSPDFLSLYLIIFAGFGILFRSRWIAVLFLILYVWNQVSLVLEFHRFGNLLVQFIFILYMVRGTIGIFKWHQLRKIAGIQEGVWKKTRGVVIAILLLLLGLVASILPTITDNINIDTESKIWIDEVAPQILESWDIDTFLQHTNPILFEETSEEEVRSLINKLKEEFGDLKKYEGSVGEGGVKFLNGETYILCDYKISAEFERGRADIYIQGVKNEEGWKIYGFRVELDQSI